jgi:hypothetical protein
MLENSHFDRLSICVLISLLSLLGITLSFLSNAVEDSDELKQRSMEAYKQYDRN